MSSHKDLLVVTYRNFVEIPIDKVGRFTDIHLLEGLAKGYLVS
jgi:hypothetical protein